MEAERERLRRWCRDEATDEELELCPLDPTPAAGRALSGNWAEDEERRRVLWQLARGELRRRRERRERRRWAATTLVAVAALTSSASSCAVQLYDHFLAPAGAEDEDDGAAPDFTPRSSAMLPS